MKLLNLTPKFFLDSPEIKTHFAAGEFNFSLSDEQTVVKERKEFLETAGLKRNQVITLSHQLHSHDVIYTFLEESDADFLSAGSLEGDGLYTDKKNTYLAVRGADCPSVLVYNPKTKIIAAIHAGWRGIKAGILKNALRVISNKFSVKTSDFYFYFGPGAGSCCYEVSKYLGKMSDFEDFFAPDLVKRGNQTFLDVATAGRRQLKENGIDEKQIENSGICTIHNQGYPSHRREGTKRRQVLLTVIGRV